MIHASDGYLSNFSTHVQELRISGSGTWVPGCHLTICGTFSQEESLNDGGKHALECKFRICVLCFLKHSIRLEACMLYLGECSGLVHVLDCGGLYSKV